MIPKEWERFFDAEEVEQVMSKVKKDIGDGILICPKQGDIFRAFELCPPSFVDVVIIGQDPYPDPEYAHGLSFSSKSDGKLPSSLRNIFKEVDNDFNVGVEWEHNGDLTGWAEQGVLLLNTHLTTQAHVPLSHIDYGWEHITDRVVAQLSHEKKNIVFLLWGKHAQEKIDLIDKSKHYVLTAAHPSPLSAYRGFFGSRCFTLCNTALMQEGKTPIDWNG